VTNTNKLDLINAPVRGVVDVVADEIEKNLWKLFPAGNWVCPK
jgi:hypothetical protein